MCHQILFVLYHDSIETKFLNEPSIIPINLNKINIGEYQTNQLAESRFFFSDIAENYNSEYVGIFSYKHNKKFHKLMCLQSLHRLQFQKNVIWAPYVASEDWAYKSEISHSGIMKYIEELALINNFEMNKKNGVFCNSFLCHMDEYIKFKKFFVRNFMHFYKKYGYDMEYSGGFKNRHANYFYERFATIYFSNSQLIVKKLPYKKFFL
jgi:hypothetical protein